MKCDDDYKSDIKSVIENSLVNQNYLKAQSSNKMQKRQSNKKPQPKQQRIVHTGIFISNQRRKGPGGRIKCDKFEGKIQVMDFNAAIHESQIEWVEIRRYVRGEKRENQGNKRNGGRNHGKGGYENKEGKDNVKGNGQKNGKKFVEVKKDQKKETQLKGQKSQLEKKNEDKKQVSQVTEGKQERLQQNSESPSVDAKIDAKVQPNLQEKQAKKKQQTEERVQDDDIETQSENEDNERQDEIEIVKKQQAVIVIKKTSQVEVKGQASQKAQTKKQGQKPVQEIKQKRQQVIVARILKQTKIIYKQKRFVAILTCQKRRDLRNSFIQKDIKPIQKICQDYFLDVTPIHSRLPKMQLDNLVPENLQVLTQYIQKIHPEKGKELTKKKLNEILDVCESIYVVASFGLWEKNRPYANVHQVIGKTMTIDGECNCFLFEHHLNDFHYQEEQIKEEKEKQIEFSPSEKHMKFDNMVFSIDPATSIDLDDALSIQKVPNSPQQLYQIGIHISDVSQYLKYIDRTQLAKRTTSVYLPHKVYHMLTPELVKIASLNPNVERLAFSVYVRMNMQGDIVGESRVEKNVIKSRFKLSYETVQDVITAKINFDQFLKKHPGTQVGEFDLLVEKLQMLTKIGKAHRQKRIKFQVFENREIHFELDNDRWPIEISVESRFMSKKIVQEYMIIGNVQAARHIIKHSPQNALIIYHPMPSQLSIKMFNQTFKFLNKSFVFDDIHAVQKQFLQIENDKTIEDGVRQYMYFKGRRMQQSAGYMLYHDAVKDILEKTKAKNGAEGKQQEIKLKNVHFALGQDFYTHFTSPMRRMADIMVHQTLNSLIYNTQPKPILPQQIQKINLGRKHTKRLKKDLTQMYICLMIHKTNKQIKQQGIITSYGLKSVSIYIPYFDMMKEVMWREELEIDSVRKNKQNEEVLDVCVYYDKRSSAGDVFWKVKKYDKVGLVIDCTKRPPLRLAISLEVTCTKGKKELIKAYFPID